MASRRVSRRKPRSSTPEYNSWSSMKSRCISPKSTRWNYYGGRGIKVCDRWLTFENFLADMGKRPANKTLDRINNDGNYEPGNCRWATQKQQVSNTRKRRPTPLRTDISGRKFFRLSVLRFVRMTEKHKSVWACRCVCGNTVEALGTNLLTKHTRSCGCLKKDLDAARRKSK